MPQLCVFRLLYQQRLVLFSLLIFAGPIIPQSFANGTDNLRQASSAQNKNCTLGLTLFGDLQQVRDAAFVLPQPLRTDALIRIAIKISSFCPLEAQSLLIQAFEQMAGPKDEIAHVSVARLVDSRASSRAKSASMKMDQLSLKSRIVLNMAVLNPKLAIRFFQSIPPPHPGVASCEDPSVPDVSIYYQALEKVLELFQTHGIEGTGVNLLLELEQVVGASTSPIQLAPLILLLQHAHENEDNLSLLLASLAARIERFPVDDRSLSAAGPAAIAAMASLVNLTQHREGTINPVLLSFRAYLLRSFQGMRCGDNLAQEQQSIPQLYASFNSLLANLAGIPPLELGASRPSVGPKPIQFVYWRSAKSGAMLSYVKRLNFGENGINLPDFNPNSSPWQGQIQNFLNEIYNWKSDDEGDATDYYHERCILLRSILAKLPPSAEVYTDVLAALVSTFENSPLQFNQPTEWYLEVLQSLQSSKRTDTDGGYRKMLAALSRSRNTYLSAAFRLSQFLG